MAWKFFDRLDKLASAELRKSAHYWISKNRHIEDKAMGWVEQSSTLLNQFFGKKHLSWRCFFLSSLMSLTTVLIITILIYDVRSLTFNHIIQTLMLGAILNIFPDYMSLMESRVIFKYMEKSRNVIKLLWLLFDLILTALIFIGIPILIISIIFSIYESAPLIESISVISEMTSYLLFGELTKDVSSLIKGFDKLILVFFLSTFSTSIWLWIYGLALILTKLFNTLGFSAKLLRQFNIKEHPYSVIGTAAGAIIFIVALLVLNFFNS